MVLRGGGGSEGSSGLMRNAIHYAETHLPVWEGGRGDDRIKTHRARMDVDVEVQVLEGQYTLKHHTTLYVRIKLRKKKREGRNRGMKGRNADGSL
jgi:hypothetical protein